MHILSIFNDNCSVTLPSRAGCGISSEGKTYHGASFIDEGGNGIITLMCHIQQHLQPHEHICANREPAVSCTEA